MVYFFYHCPLQKLQWRNIMLHVLFNHTSTFAFCSFLTLRLANSPFHRATNRNAMRFLLSFQAAKANEKGKSSRERWIDDEFRNLVPAWIQSVDVPPATAVRTPFRSQVCLLSWVYSDDRDKTVRTKSSISFSSSPRGTRPAASLGGSASNPPRAPRTAPNTDPLCTFSPPTLALASSPSQTRSPLLLAPLGAYLAIRSITPGRDDPR
mmetsp:Transcript_337/g.618  ORF Transcript_337/g.618 Transcript_337/m.618 type:complete len:208 (+) Transcript_337:140-763(+)